MGVADGCGTLFAEYQILHICIIHAHAYHAHGVIVRAQAAVGQEDFLGAVIEEKCKLGAAWIALPAGELVALNAEPVVFVAAVHIQCGLAAAVNGFGLHRITNGTGETLQIVPCIGAVVPAVHAAELQLPVCGFCIAHGHELVAFFADVTGIVGIDTGGGAGGLCLLMVGQIMYLCVDQRVIAILNDDAFIFLGGAGVVNDFQCLAACEGIGQDVLHTRGQQYAVHGVAAVEGTEMDGNGAFVKDGAAAQIGSLGVDNKVFFACFLIGHGLRNAAVHHGHAVVITLGEGDLCQRGAAHEGSFEVHQILGQLQCHQIVQVIEGVVADGAAVLHQNGVDLVAAIVPGCAAGLIIVHKAAAFFCVDGQHAVLQRPVESIAAHIGGGSRFGSGFGQSVGIVVNGCGLEGIIVILIDFDLSPLCFCAAEVHIGQPIASAEGALCDFSYGSGDVHSFQSGGIRKARVADCLQSFGKCYRGQLVTGHKSALSDFGDRIGDGDFGQTVAIGKCRIGNACEVFGQGDLAQITAHSKGVAAHGGDGIGNDDFVECVNVRKCRAADGCKTAGQRYGFYGAAVCKEAVRQLGDAFLYLNGGEDAADAAGMGAPCGLGHGTAAADDQSLGHAVIGPNSVFPAGSADDGQLGGGILKVDGGIEKGIVPFIDHYGCPLVFCAVVINIGHIEAVIEYDIVYFQQAPGQGHLLQIGAIGKSAGDQLRDTLGDDQLGNVGGVESSVSDGCDGIGNLIIGCQHRRDYH